MSRTPWYRILRISSHAGLRGSSATQAVRQHKTLQTILSDRLLGPRAQAALTRAWELIADSIVAEAIQLRNDLRAILNTSTSRADAREQFDQLRQSWPTRFQPWHWQPGTPLDPPHAPETEGPTALHQYLEAIMAFFVRHFEMMITYLDRPGVPRTNNHAERANRRYRAVARPRYGWTTARGQRAMLVALQGFDSS